MKRVFYWALVVLFILGCSSDDEDLIPQSCPHQGFSYVFGNGNPVFNDASNLITTIYKDDEDDTIVQIYDLLGSETVLFTTKCVNLNQSSKGIININTAGDVVVDVILEKQALKIGDDLRYFIEGEYMGQLITAEFCVTVNQISL